MADKPSDRSALMWFALLGSMLGNLLLLSQLFVWRPEYVAELRIINSRLSTLEVSVNRIERKIDNADPQPAATR